MIGKLNFQVISNTLQIGAFYEREIEYNIRLIYTDGNGLPITAGFGNAASVPTSVDEVSYAVLDGSGGNHALNVVGGASPALGENIDTIFSGIKVRSYKLDVKVKLKNFPS